MACQLNGMLNGEVNDLHHTIDQNCISYKHRMNVTFIIPTEQNTLPLSSIEY